MSKRANKCFCDICGRTIYTEGGVSPRVIKYWNAPFGTIENNRKVETAKYDLCCVDCCLEFMNEQDTKLSNPFTDFYFEIVPIKVLGEAEV